MQTPTYMDAGAQRCHWCGRGFIVDLPAVYVPRLSTFHEICPHCIGLTKVSGPGPRRFDLRRILSHFTGQQPGTQTQLKGLT